MAADESVQAPGRRRQEAGETQLARIQFRISDSHSMALTAYRHEVDLELTKLKVRQAAKDALRIENEPKVKPFDAGTLAEVLARPPEPAMRVEGLIPWESSTLIVAMRKTGKTTFVLNLANSLLTGADFLGSFTVQPVRGNVAILNYEVSGRMLAGWARDHHIDQRRFYLVNLRGGRNPLSHPEDRARLAAKLRDRNTETLLVDPFGRAYTGTSENDSGEVGSFLQDLDVFTRSEVGARDLILTAHAGWGGERSRGSSALEDWADSIITLTRDPDDESQRFLKAMGRDVDQDEDRLDFNPATRTLTMSGTGSRKKGKADRKVIDLAVYVVRAASLHPGIGVAEMEKAIRNMEDPPAFHKGEVSRAARRAQELGHLRIQGGGPGVKSQHFAIDLTTSPRKTHTPPNPPRIPTGGSTHTHPDPPYRGRVGVGEVDGDAQPEKPGWVAEQTEESTDTIVEAVGALAVKKDHPAKVTRPAGRSAS